MQHLNTLINKEYKIRDTDDKTRKTERGELISTFHQRINKERLNTKYKPLSIRFIAVKVGHLKTPDLYHLLKISEQGDSFSKVWFGSLKLKA